MRVGIGTAQFGFRYGISNTFGRPAPDEIARIIEAARTGGIDVIDTAHGYGESESAIGRYVGTNGPFKIVTKTLPLSEHRVTDADVRRVLSAFQLSLERLRQTAVYALLVHHAGDLLAHDSALLMNALLDLKARRLVEKIGVSVYDQKELDAVLERHPIDIVQIPFSVLDQRLLASGSIARLKRAGVEVHARSIFLQGLLLMDPEALDKHFCAVQKPIRRLRALALERGQTPLEIAVGFVAGCEAIDCAIVGISRHEEMKEIIAAFQRDALLEDYDSFAISDEAILNPACWPH